MILTTAHVQSWRPWMDDWLRDVKPQWAKIINPPAGFVIPGVANSLVRIWTDNIDAAYIARGRTGGRDFVQMMQPRWQQNPATSYSLWNEPDVNSNVGLANLREATIGAVEEAAALGIRVCVGEFAEGNPHNNNSGSEDATVWKLSQLRPALKVAADAGMYFGRHCYWRPGVEGPTGRWHALGRLKWDLEQLNIPNLKTLVTEWGIDGGVAGGPAQQGWQRLTTETQYRDWLVEGESYARTLPGVEALMIFGFGATDVWLSGGFDIPEGFARSLVAPLKALAPVVAPPSIPPVATPPEPEPVENADGRLIIELARPLALTPQTNVVTQWFGANPSMYAQFGMAGHNGVDYRAPEGTPVLAAHPGIVRVYDEGSKGLGKYVKVTYIDGAGRQRYTTYYAHLSAHKVTMGQRVTRGQVIGLSGNTGNSTGAHLHFGLKVVGMVNPAYNDAIDPCPWRTL